MIYFKNSVFIPENTFSGKLKKIIIPAAFGSRDNRIFSYVIKFRNKH